MTSASRHPLVALRQTIGLTWTVGVETMVSIGSTEMLPLRRDRGRFWLGNPELIAACDADGFWIFVLSYIFPSYACSIGILAPQAVGGSVSKTLSGCLVAGERWRSVQPAHFLAPARPETVVKRSRSGGGCLRVKTLFQIICR